MRGLYAFDKRQDSAASLEQAIEFFQETIRRDENFGPAYVILATAYALLPTYRDVPDSEIYRLAVETAENGHRRRCQHRGCCECRIRLRASQGNELARVGGCLQGRHSEADIVDPNAFNWYSRMLASVGRLDDSLVQAQRGGRTGPDVCGVQQSGSLSLISGWVMPKTRPRYFRSRE